MNYLHPKHWQDLVGALLGVWLVVAPWALGFSGDSLALSNSVVIGLALLAAALGALFVPRAWEEWTEGALGLWMAASPWILGYAHLTLATASAFITGITVLCCAVWVIATDRDIGGWLAGPAA